MKLMSEELSRQCFLVLFGLRMSSCVRNRSGGHLQVSFGRCQFRLSEIGSQSRHHSVHISTMPKPRCHPMNRKRMPQIVQSWLVTGTICTRDSRDGPCPLKALGECAHIHEAPLDRGEEGYFFIGILAVFGVLVDLEDATQVFTYGDVARSVDTTTSDYDVLSSEVNVLALQIDPFTHKCTSCIKKNQKCAQCRCIDLACIISLRDSRCCKEAVQFRPRIDVGKRSSERPRPEEMEGERPTLPPAQPSRERSGAADRVSPAK